KECGNGKKCGMDITVINKQGVIRIDKKSIKKSAKIFLRSLRHRKNSILNVIFVSPAEIRKINIKYFNKNKTTDVIALAAGKFGKARDIYYNYLGDIIICPQTAKRNCAIFGTSLKKELLLYTVHGILHLVGWDDLNKKDSAKMSKKQEELLDLL
ncbi:MAG: rRNA maturation RNase YbeY, partial [Candidatus Omnitrophica bacterium]|nr:rRNA maturation RNase YbeY [Candidatus Omnitrophota bacterium]